jgi:hypothetical protein
MKFIDILIGILILVSMATGFIYLLPPQTGTPCVQELYQGHIVSREMGRTYRTHGMWVCSRG